MTPSYREYNLPSFGENVNMPPFLYAVGDLQGCLESLENLLEIVPSDADLLFVGDLVNRGPQSLATLRFVKRLGDAGRARTLLGNHDLHLLAVAAGAGSVHRKDTIGEILTAPDGAELIDWLRCQPLLIDTPDVVFVHAGIPPHWTLEKAKTLALEAETHLKSDHWKDYLQNMYGSTVFQDDLTGSDRMRGILNGLTRMRFIGPDGEPEFTLKEGADKAPAGFKPWFECRRRVTKTICFGHWSTLGLIVRPDLVAIDTGCLWGGKLTAVRFPDRRLFQETCPQWAVPGC